MRFFAVGDPPGVAPDCGAAGPGAAPPPQPEIVRDTIRAAAKEEMGAIDRFILGLVISAVRMVGASFGSNAQG